MTQSHSNTIADKIKKLLRLARCPGATAAEAANALSRAMEMIEKHQIDASSLDLDEEAERIVDERIQAGQRVSLIKKLVANLLVHFFSVRVIRECDRFGDVSFVLVGYEHDVTIAQYVFEFLTRACTKASSRYAATERQARRRVTLRKKQGFVEGWIWGVASNLHGRKKAEALTDGSAAIVLADRARRRDARYEELFPNRTSAPVKTAANKTARERGWVEGRNTTINQPLNAPTRETLCLE